ncbi:regulator of cell autolysis [Clostridium sp. AM22-16AC]|nr:LytS/YhcK type 5TM receptor domain-containing protein [Clostridium sp. AM22-16AC]RHO04220.1 regulator of cell autolysis [Clostridium sp. AM22-16AC]
MLLDVIYSICFNICLLVVLAFMMTKMDFVQRLLLNEEGGSEEGRGENVWQRLWEKVLIGVIFGVFCIISDYIGIQVTGALPNARVIGVLSAGFLGGPVSGFITTVIAATHRYLIFPERISTVACVLSAIIHGLIGSFIGWKKKGNRQYSNTFLLGVTFISEMIHIVLILLLTRPFDAAVEIVKIVIVPMVIINSVGMVIFFNVFKSIFNTEDLKVASKVSQSMRIAERCTPYLGDVETDPKSAGKIIDIIMEEYHCQGAALIDSMKFLALSGAFAKIILTENNYPRLLSATKTYKTTRISRVPIPEDGFYPLYQQNVIISAPILLDEGKVLALVILVKKNAYSYRADIEFATGLANHFAMQMKIAKMEKQKEELRKAELRTLQSQINPHFLFNSLNTISYFCREKPEKARELLLALSSYFRNMLDDIDYMVMLDTELEHVKAYTMLEEARFEKRLSIEINADPEALKCCVPNLILQPIVENAVHHGAMQREKGVGKVIVNVKQEEKSTRIDVIDNGPGIDYRIIQSLYGGEKVEHTGIGMMNVQQRLIAIYGNGHGLQIVSSEEGTDVRMNIPCSVNAGAAQ